MKRLDPKILDDGIRDTVLLLRKAGYKTFTSCEGGKGHAFHEPTIGLEFDGDYFAFRDKLVKFLQSNGMQLFEVCLISSYNSEYPEGINYIYLQGFDIAAPERQKQMDRAMKRREKRLNAQLFRT